MQATLPGRALGRRAVSALAYVLAVLAFFELSSRVALSVPAVLKRTAGINDAAWRLRWVGRERPQGIAYTFDVYHPTRGWALRPSLRQEPAFAGKVLSSNSRGLRGRAEYSDRKRPGLSRVLVFGDSFTFGEDVSDDDTYAACLQSLGGAGAEVLNFGVHGYGHDQMLLYLQEQGIRYHPDVVILGFVDWDMERNLLEFRDYAKPRFETRGGQLVLRNTPVPTPEQVLAAARYRPQFLDLLSMAGAGMRRRLGWTQAESTRVTSALLDAFRQLVEGVGAKLVIAYLPAEREIEPAPSPPEGQEFIARYCRERSVEYVDLRRVFVEREDSGEHLKARGHWNRREHRLAAEAIAARLAERGWVAPAARQMELGLVARGASPMPGSGTPARTVPGSRS